MRQVYLDTAAATPVDSRVIKAMLPYYRWQFANPSSLHEPGLAAAQALAAARSQIAACLKAHPDEIVFTGGGTEGNSLAILGVARAAGRGKHIITTVIEHASVLEPCRALERAGWRVTYLSVNRDGLFEPRLLAKSLRSDTVLVSIGYVNNEIGTIQPLREIARVIRRFKKAQNKKRPGQNYPYFHTDACQAPRFLELAVNKLGVDLLTLNSAKIYGPKGVGCLYLRRGLNLEPLVYGGGQEAGRRSGTENVPGIVGFARALALCAKLRAAENRRLTARRDYLIRRLLKIPGVSLNGSPAARAADNVNVVIEGVLAEQLVIELAGRGVAVSTGSACAIPHREELYVIMALGKSRTAAESSVRFTLDRKTTQRDLDYVLQILPPIIKKLR